MDRTSWDIRTSTHKAHKRNQTGDVLVQGRVASPDRQPAACKPANGLDYSAPSLNTHTTELHGTVGARPYPSAVTDLPRTPVAPGATNTTRVSARRLSRG